MPRSRGPELPQRQSTRAPLNQKTNSEANSLHRPASVAAVDRRSKPEDRRSPRSPLHEIQKKRGTKVADLETKLGKAQEELKKLRDQLALAEAGKLDAQQALEMAKKQIPSSGPEVEAVEEEKLLLSLASEETSEVTQEALTEEESVNSPNATDVFEVAAPTEPISQENDDSKPEEEPTVAETEEEEVKTTVEKENDEKGQMVEEKEEEESKEGEELLESPEVVELKALLLEKAKEVGILLEETVLFKTRAEDETARTAAAARAKEEELTTKMRSAEEELKQSRAKAELLTEQLHAAEAAKATMEAEMKRLRVQMEQWRKAAEAAAAELAPDIVGHEEWGPALMAGYGMGEEGAAGRRKGAGVRVFGDLWKKKGQHK